MGQVNVIVVCGAVHDFLTVYYIVCVIATFDNAHVIAVPHIWQ